MEEPYYTSRRSLLNLIMGGLTMRGAAGLSLASLRAARAETIAAPDGLSPPESVEGAAVIDGDTLKLAGGETLRLSGIEAPKRDLAPGDAALRGLAEAAAGALNALVGTGPIILRQDAGKRDRYGRPVYYRYVPVREGPPHGNARGYGRNGPGSFRDVECSVQGKCKVVHHDTYHDHGHHWRDDD